MPDVARIRVAWSGTPVVGPGVSTFYLAGSVTTGWPAALMTLFTTLKGYVPNGVTFTVPGDVEILDAESGDLIGANSPGGGGSLVSSGGAVDYKPGVGARIRWGTVGIVGGRRVKGTTFVVPVTSQEIPSGVLQGSTVATWTTAVNAYKNTSGISPCIYSRHRPERVVDGVTIPERLGSTHLITSASVPSALTWLRTRRT